MTYMIEIRDVKGVYELTHEYDKDGHYTGSFVQKMENGNWDRVRISVLDLSRLGVSVDMSYSIKDVFNKLKDGNVST